MMRGEGYPTAEKDDTPYMCNELLLGQKHFLHRKSFTETSCTVAGNRLQLIIMSQTNIGSRKMDP